MNSIIGIGPAIIGDQVAIIIIGDRVTGVGEAFTSSIIVTDAGILIEAVLGITPTLIRNVIMHIECVADAALCDLIDRIVCEVIDNIRDRVLNINKVMLQGRQCIVIGILIGCGQLVAGVPVPIKQDGMGTTGENIIARSERDIRYLLANAGITT